MENETYNEEEVQAEQKNQLHQVTPLSKYLALTLFIILPFLGGWVGYTYSPEKVVEVEKIVIRQVEVVQDVSSTEIIVPNEEVNSAEDNKITTVPAIKEIVLQDTPETENIKKYLSDEGIRTIFVNSDTAKLCEDFEDEEHICVRFDDPTVPGTRKVVVFLLDELSGFSYDPLYEYVITVEQLRTSGYGDFDVSQYDYSLMEVLSKKEVIN